MLNQLKEEMLLQIKDTIDKCEKIPFSAVRKREENDASCQPYSVDTVSYTVSHFQGINPIINLNGMYVR